MDSAAWVKNALEIGGLHYKQTHHNDESFTSQEVAQREHISGHRMAKVVAVLIDEKPTLLVLPASRRVSLPQVRQATGAISVRLVTESEMPFLFPDCEIGAIPPMRHWPNVEIVTDSSLEGTSEILFQAGNHRDAIRMPFREWHDLVRPRIESFSIAGDSGPRNRDIETIYDEEGK